MQRALSSTEQVRVYVVISYCCTIGLTHPLYFVDLVHRSVLNGSPIIFISINYRYGGTVLYRLTPQYPH
jgi:hypothetical protein